MRCKACNREAIQGDFCPLHLKAYNNIAEKYAVWRKALNIPWEEYLREIAKHSLTGDHAKETAKSLTNKEEAKNGKEI